jgi:hypothetical protein
MLNSGAFAARPVTWFRIAVAIAVVMVSIENLVTMLDAAGERIAIPLLPALPPVSTGVAIVLGTLGIVSGFALASGHLPRASAGLATVAMLAVQVVEQQAYSSHHVLAILFTGYLALIGSSRRESVARLPVLIVLTQVSVVYLFTAIAKLNPVFLSGSVLRESFAIPLPDVVFAVMAWASVIFEFFLVVGLWLRPTTSVAVILGTLFHLTIATTLHDPFGLWAFTLLMVGTYPLFVYRSGVDATWRRLYERARAVEFTAR